MILERSNFMDVKQIMKELDKLPMKSEIGDLKELAQIYQLRHSGVTRLELSWRTWTKSIQ